MTPLLLQGTWGCNNLKAVINTGAEIDISPIRVAGFALPSGSLQRLYLASQGGYRSGSRGEELSRLQRLEPTSRPFKNYSGRIVLLAPPILMQRRVVASAEVPLKCDVSPSRIRVPVSGATSTCMRVQSLVSLPP